MIILGSSGSIGCNALDVAQNFCLPVETLVAGYNIALLNQQIHQFHPRFVVVAEQSLVNQIDTDSLEAVFVGTDGILQALRESRSTLVLNALSGFLGLEPTLYAQSLGKTIALANKESLVVGGAWIDCAHIIPVDSEHFSLWFLQQSRQPFDELILTASGGAARDVPLESLASQKAADMLRHPNWAMGKKITIDSATMANKLFEILEAYWLFRTTRLHALIERNSLIHALVRFADGSLSAHLAKNDMRLPIAYALLGSEALQTALADKPFFESLNLCAMPPLSFSEIDTKRYPLWALKESLLANPQLGVVINAANEIAVELYLHGRILFTQIAHIVQDCLQCFADCKPTLETIATIDSNVRAKARAIASTLR